MAAALRPSEWWQRWRRRLSAWDGSRMLLLLLLLGSGQGPRRVWAGQTFEYLKREHSLSKPYQGVGTGSSSLWNLMGNAMPCFLRDWELQVHFKIHGQGKKNLHGDGLAIWYTKDRMQPGPVFGNMDKFVGLGVFVDTYPNEEKQQEAQKRRYSPGVQRVFPYISAMVNNGSLSYDHERDGRPTELGGCTAIVRNLHYDTFLVIRYVKRHLTIMMDIDGKHEWRDCIEVPGVRLPRGYYFGTSSITGDLSDNHDVISLKLFELTVERTPEEEKLHRDVFLPSVDNMKLPDMTAPLPPLSGLALFLIVFFSLVFSVFAIVIGIILYNKWQEQSRKRFY
ncbi:VIP36-like protein isoform X3 [Marmota monax]|uniref:VIP36-like protein isoform X3 n=1 Tax=Marmota flaviventris TaxID=93162 RepID=UPI000FFFB0B7|nr:VIP36-like protein isoform X3 [Marmota flaviventris]XP_040126686.1 VIP36-like protein isoform X3 [Ictidomys tridecemlineatus]XP_046276079.1 VIP36-like protein isoform X3 [Marmota monax]